MADNLVIKDQTLFDKAGHVLSHSSTTISGTDLGNLQSIPISDSTSQPSSTVAASSTAVKSAYDLAANAIPKSEKGAANGVAVLDADGKIGTSQFPDSIQSVLSFANFLAFPATGSVNIIYIANDTNKLYRWSGVAYVEVSAAPTTVSSALKLQTARTISSTGDATWSVSFDGSANATATLTLTSSGVTAGTYTKVTVDSKGRTITGSSLSASDVPDLDWSKITTGKPTTLAGYGITDAFAGVTAGTGITVSGSQISLASLTLGNAGVFNKFAVDTYGRVTSITPVVSSDLTNLITSLSGLTAVSATSLSGELTGNASTASKLKTARTIAGSSFDGSANIDISFANLTNIPTTLAGYGITNAYTKTEVDSAISAATPTFSTLSDKPTTLSGYGITDAYTKTEIDTAISAATPTFSSLSGKPTTLAGYGIADAQDTLVSGTNIKTINGQSLLGAGDIAIAGGSTTPVTSAAAGSILMVDWETGEIVGAQPNIDYLATWSDNSHPAFFDGAISSSVSTFSGTLNISLMYANNMVVEIFGDDTLSFSDVTPGMSGNILFKNPNGATISKTSNVKSSASFLSTISQAGEYYISYFSPTGSYVYVTTSGSLS